MPLGFCMGQSMQNPSFAFGIAPCRGIECLVMDVAGMYREKSKKSFFMTCNSEKMAYSMCVAPKRSRGI